MSYNNIETIRGGVAELVEKKLGLEPGKHLLQYGTETQYDGYCETCWSEWDAFIILVDGEEVYNSGYRSAYSPFEDLQDWLEGDE